MNLTEELTQCLKDCGAALTGYGDMIGVPGCEYRTGVSVAIPVPIHIIRDLQNAPTKEYAQMYHELNGKLNHIVTTGAEFLTTHGYRAFAQTTTAVQIDDECKTLIPHKTVATRAGLGWIGKNCLLVTQEFGSAVRISSLLTDAPLNASEPIIKSRCGNCRCCVDACPAHALKGTLWTSETPREDMFAHQICYEKQIEIMSENTGIETDLCGKCFAVCAYTQRYINGGNNDADSRV